MLRFVSARSDLWGRDDREAGRQIVDAGALRKRNLLFQIEDEGVAVTTHKVVRMANPISPLHKIPEDGEDYLPSKSTREMAARPFPRTSRDKAHQKARFSVVELTAICLS